LRSLGAKPAIYGSEQVYCRLAESERYRFQVSRSAPSASWRHEREWRLRGDLAFDCILDPQLATRDSRHPEGADPQPGSPGFVFVQTEEEKAKLFSHVNSGLSIVALDASR
jgi:hypothetical protein